MVTYVEYVVHIPVKFNILLYCIDCVLWYFSFHLHYVVPSTDSHFDMFLCHIIYYLVILYQDHQKDDTYLV